MEVGGRGCCIPTVLGTWLQDRDGHSAGSGDTGGTCQQRAGPPCDYSRVGKAFPVPGTFWDLGHFSAPGLSPGWQRLSEHTAPSTAEQPGTSPQPAPSRTICISQNKVLP